MSGEGRIRATSGRAFLGLFQRDVWHMVRHDLAGFLAQALLQPIIFLFVFGRVLPDTGMAGPGYGAQLLPGIVALTLVLSALQNVAMPLVMEFSSTKEIEDRLLAPLPAAAVGMEKIMFAACRAVLAAALIIPLGSIILPGDLPINDANWPLFVPLLILGGLIGGSIGLVLGTLVPARRIGMVIALSVTPLIFTGATFYPWQALGDLRWFQVMSLLNPLTYVSEGVRATLTATPHLDGRWVSLGLVVSIAVFSTVGMKGFLRRAVD